MAQNTPDSIRTAWILFATAFAAGAVDIIGFAKLGGVFASAMTGNFALLAYHVARGNTLSAIGSLIALLGFVAGCLVGFRLRRGRSPRTTISLLLGAEAGLLLLFTFIPAVRLQIATLAIAMGLQAVVGRRGIDRASDWWRPRRRTNRTGGLHARGGAPGSRSQQYPAFRTATNYKFSYAHDATIVQVRCAGMGLYFAERASGPRLRTNLSGRYHAPSYPGRADRPHIGGQRRIRR